MPPPPPPPGPPPPPVATSKAPPAGKSRNALLGDIQKGTRLKKTETKDRSAPIFEAPKNNSNNAMASSSSSGGARAGAPLGPSSSMPQAGPAALGGLFAGGMPKLRSTKSTAVPTASGGKSNSNSNDSVNSNGHSGTPGAAGRFPPRPSVAATGGNATTRGPPTAARNPPAASSAESIGKASSSSSSSSNQLRSSGQPLGLKPVMQSMDSVLSPTSATSRFGAGSTGNVLGTGNSPVSTSNPSLSPTTRIPPRVPLAGARPSISGPSVPGFDAGARPSFNSGQPPQSPSRAQPPPPPSRTSAQPPPPPSRTFMPPPPKPASLVPVRTSDLGQPPSASPVSATSPMAGLSLNRSGSSGAIPGAFSGTHSSTLSPMAPPSRAPPPPVPRRHSNVSMSPSTSVVPTVPSPPVPRMVPPPPPPSRNTAPPPPPPNARAQPPPPPTIRSASGAVLEQHGRWAFKAESELPPPRPFMPAMRQYVSGATSGNSCPPITTGDSNISASTTTRRPPPPPSRQPSQNTFAPSPAGARKAPPPPPPSRRPPGGGQQPPPPPPR